MRLMRNSFLIAAVALTSAAGASGAQVAAPERIIWHNKVAPTVSATVSLDPAIGDLVYRYTLANGPANQFLPARAADRRIRRERAGRVGCAAHPRSATWLAVGDVDPA